jgi:hypothetical protein
MGGYDGQRRTAVRNALNTVYLRVGRMAEAGEATDALAKSEFEGRYGRELGSETEKL